ncbi:MAG: hypothetical protein ACRERC_21650 [Candidatus Binatia bacterium]
MLALLLAPAPEGVANAITITYVNPGPLDSRVFVGFDNDAAGNLTTDFVVQPSAASRNDTVYGPLPPIGQLPSFEAMAYGSAELGTNLNAPLGAGVRSVFAPLNVPFFRAHGETLVGTGFYSSHAYAHSGDATSITPTHWIVHVDPSGAEVAGTPADVTVTGTLSGSVSVAGASLADAAWNVATTGFGTVMAGTATQAVPGSTPFSDAGSLTFTLPLGGTFQLVVDYDLSTSGSGPGANSTSEIAASLVQISAVIAPPLAPFSTTFLAPLLGGTTAATPAGPFQARRAIRVQMQLRDTNGDLVSDAVAKTLDVGVEVFPVPAGPAIDLGPRPPRIRYRARKDMFVFRLKTRAAAFVAGQTYRLVIDVAGTPVGEGFFSLN